jgi:hypothetical protein
MSKAKPIHPTMADLFDLTFGGTVSIPVMAQVVTQTQVTASINGISVTTNTSITHNYSSTDIKLMLGRFTPDLELSKSDLNLRGPSFYKKWAATEQWLFLNYLVSLGALSSTKKQRTTLSANPATIYWIP